MSGAGDQNLIKVVKAHTLAQVAKMLGGVSTRTIKRAIERGELPTPTRIGGTWMMLADELQAALERNKAAWGQR